MGALCGGSCRVNQAKNYIECLKNYRGEVLLVGVNYDKEKHHTCKIEKIKKQ